MIRAGVKAVIAVLLRVPARKEIVVASVYTCYVDNIHNTQLLEATKSVFRWY
jgi:hypothetical protein